LGAARAGKVAVHGPSIASQAPMPRHSVTPAACEVRERACAADLVLLHLQTHAFTKGFADPEMAQLAEIAAEVTFQENEIILFAGQCSTALYLLLCGSAAVELRAPSYSVCLQALRPGHAFGWSALLDQQETVFQVRARERSTTLRIDGAALSALCRSHPHLGVKILTRALHVVASRVKATEACFAEMCGMKV
jgi:CRP-like cAMP-binding protein